MKRRLIKLETKEVEVYEDICDGCHKVFSWENKREVSANIKFEFGYHSNLDGYSGVYCLCNQCAESLHNLMKPHFPLLDDLREYNVVDPIYISALKNG